MILKSDKKIIIRFYIIYKNLDILYKVIVTQLPCISIDWKNEDLKRGYKEKYKQYLIYHVWSLLYW